MPIPETPARPQVGTLADRLTTTVLDAIVTGEFAPDDPISDSTIAKMAGVSRTPVREALDRIADLGLLTVLPSGRMRVAPLDDRRYLQTLETIAPLVAQTARALCEFADAEETALVLDRLERDDVFAVDGLFATVIGLFGSARLTAAWDELVPQIRRMIALQPEHGPTPLTAAHRSAIRSAFTARDGLATADAFSEWFRSNGTR